MREPVKDLEYLLFRRSPHDPLVRDALARSFYAEVYRLAWLTAGDHRQAWKLADTAMAAALRNLHRFKPGSNLRVWLFQQAVNVLLHPATARLPADLLAESGELRQDDSTGPGSRKGADPHSLPAARALATIALESRLALLFRYGYALTPRQTGGVLGIRPARLRRLLRQGIETLRHAPAISSIGGIGLGGVTTRTHPLSRPGKPGDPQPPLSHQRARALLEGDGPASAKEQARLESHLADCPDCRPFAATATWLSEKLPELMALIPLPVDEVEARVERLISLAAGQADRTRRGLPMQETLWVLLAAGLILVIGYAFNQGNRDLRLVLPDRTPTFSSIPELDENPAAPVLVVPEREALSLPVSYEFSYDPQISDKGRWVVFTSESRSLVPDDTNDAADIFLYDRLTGNIRRVSLADDGSQPGDASFGPMLASNGRYIAFTSWDDQLVSGSDPPCRSAEPVRRCPQAYVHDWITGKTELISAAPDGTPADGPSLAAAISGDGLWVAFWSAADNLGPSERAGSCGLERANGNCFDLYLHQRLTDENDRIPIGRRLAEIGEDPVRLRSLSLSHDGHWLLLVLRAGDGIAEQLLSLPQDLYVYDRTTDQFSPVNISSQGEPGNAPAFGGSISLDGRWLAFASAASNLVPGDTNDKVDVFLRDRLTGDLQRISLAWGGGEADGDSGVVGSDGAWIPDALNISSDGRWVMFISNALNLVRYQRMICNNFTTSCFSVYLYDRELGLIDQINTAPLGLIFFTGISQEKASELNADVETCILRGLCTDVYVYEESSGAKYFLGLASPIDPRRDAASSIEQSSNWEAAYTLRGHTNRVNAVTYSPQGDLLATGSNDGNVRLWSAPDGSPLHTLVGHARPVNSLAFSPDGEILASGGDDGDIYLWRPRSGSLLGIFSGDPDLIRSLAFSPDGKMLAAGSLKKVWLWQVADGTLIRRLDYTGSYVSAVAFSPTGDLLAVAGGDESVWIHQVVDGTALLRLRGHLGRVTALAFSPDNRYLASGSVDHTVKVWALEPGGSGLSARHSLTLQHTDWVQAVQFHPQGTRLVSGSFDSTVAVWDLPNQRLQDVLLNRPQNQVLSVAISPDGAWLAGSTVRGEVFVWRHKNGDSQ